MDVVVTHAHQRKGGKKEPTSKSILSKAYHIFWPDRAVAMTFPYLSPSYLSLIIFSTSFWWFKKRCAVGHSCEQTLPRSLYALPFPLYCQPAYPALMELLKSRYEQNLGGPAFVGACVPIRWERDDKNLSNACRSCHSMHNNLCGCRKRNKVWQERERGWGDCFADEYMY